ncbi:unnamed protein product [Prorocentrum cordatum]|uniref:Uncharacterized protein n=1 Tax=Prorocentrum cordatum TaxID=2364126 RepID=A0ABN9T5C3_9DINO|nr:unnamed protein product [Polarella glacialis]
MYPRANRLTRCQEADRQPKNFFLSSPRSPAPHLPSPPHPAHPVAAQVSLADASTVSSVNATVDADPVSSPHVEPGATSSTIRTFKLRLCNAYAWPEPVEMSRVQEPKLVEYPLAYKAEALR